MDTMGASCPNCVQDVNAPSKKQAAITNKAQKSKLPIIITLVLIVVVGGGIGAFSLGSGGNNPEDLLGFWESDNLRLWFQTTHMPQTSPANAGINTFSIENYMSIANVEHWRINNIVGGLGDVGFSDGDVVRVSLANWIADNNQLALVIRSLEGIYFVRYLVIFNYEIDEPFLILTGVRGDHPRLGDVSGRVFVLTR